MTSQFQLFPVHEHTTKWKAALNLEAICPGKDPEDNACTCPDIVYSTRIRIRTGHTFGSYFYCGCCDQPIHPLGQSTA